MLYSNNHPYYPNRNKGIELFMVSIITVVTGIYDFRWRVFSRPRLPAIARIYTRCVLSLISQWRMQNLSSVTINIKTLWDQDMRFVENN